MGLGEVKFRKGESQEAVALSKEGLQKPGTPIRYRAMLWALRARALIKSTAGVEDPERCEETAPPVFAWIQSAQEAVEEAEKTGVSLPDLPIVKRQVLRRKAMLLENCPTAGK